MLMPQVLTYPFNKVVLEHTFDELVEEIRSYQFMDVCPGEVLSEWLGGWLGNPPHAAGIDGTGLTVTPSTIPYLSQSSFDSKAPLQALVCSGDRKSGSIWSRLPGDEAQLHGIGQQKSSLHLGAYHVHHPLTTAASKTCSG
jgi:hypothetical protein